MAGRGGSTQAVTADGHSATAGVAVLVVVMTVGGTVVAVADEVEVEVEELQSTLAEVVRGCRVVELAGGDEDGVSAAALTLTYDVSSDPDTVFISS